VGREVARRMITRGRGKIINIARVQSEVAKPTYWVALFNQSVDKHGRPRIGSYSTNRFSKAVKEARHE
jgi:NAD(P)-dependent dehydrogenase (short-subunit alcohol dehydrogenase family)